MAIKISFVLFLLYHIFYKRTKTARNVDKKLRMNQIYGIIILFLFCFNGWGNGGWGRNGEGINSPAGQGALTRADLCSEFNFNNLDSAVRSLQSGLCDGFYAMNTGMLNGFNGVDNAICSLGYQTQNGFNATQVAMMQGNNALQAQLADCCCNVRSDIKDVQFANLQGQNAIQTQLADCCCRTNNNLERGFADINYNMATNTCAIKTEMANNTRDIIDSQNAGTRAILDYLCQEKIADLQSENQSLRLAASQQAQNNYLISQLKPCPVPAYPSCNPWGGTSCNNCGCGCA